MIWRQTMSSTSMKAAKTQCIFPPRRTTLPQVDIDIRNKKKIATLKSHSKSIITRDIADKNITIYKKVSSTL